MAVEFINHQSKKDFHKTEFLSRIYPLTRFIDFLNNKFVFVSPTKWGDPYEKAFLEAEYFNGNRSYFHPLKPKDGYRLYAQCWTSSGQTEAMWKGFSPNEDGVLVSIAVSKLLALLTEISIQGEYDFYIGKVNYENPIQLYQMKADPRIWERIYEQRIDHYLLGLLLKKREAFDFEKEYRILAVKKEGKSEDHFVTFSIENLLRNVEYLKFDPRMGDSLFEFLRSKIRAEHPNIEIHKSGLYSYPVDRLTFNGNLPVEKNDELIFH